MKRVLVWPGTPWTYNNCLCLNCRKRLDDFKAGDSSRFMFIEIALVYFSIGPSAANMHHVFEVVKIARDWQAWRVYGQPLCGYVAPGKVPPYDMLWLPRLFQHSQPEHHQALRATLSMLALAGDQ